MSSSPFQRLSQPLTYLLAIALGILTGKHPTFPFFTIATKVASGFTFSLKWLSLPLIALSILSTTTQLEDKRELLRLSKTVWKYTLFTTLIAGGVALGLFHLIAPVHKAVMSASGTAPLLPSHFSGFGLLLLGTVGGSLLLGFYFVAWPHSAHERLHAYIAHSYTWLTQTIQLVLRLMPVVIWAFFTLFVQELQDFSMLYLLGRYLVVVVVANLLQAMVVLPLLLRSKNYAPWATFRAVFPALAMAFWAKSSGVALPLTLSTVKKGLKVSPKTANFTLPICTTINMNACAAFILTTVLFVSGMHGKVFSLPLQIGWLLVATVAAIGNAGVPMGCYTLAGVLLSYVGVPLKLMGIILPFYALLDMLESAINVWSDICVTCCVEADLHQ